MTAARTAGCLLLGLVVLVQPPAGRLAADVVPRGMVNEVVIVGNSDVAESEIRRKILTRPGRELDPATVEADYRSLMDSKWFSDVRISTAKDKRRQDGYIVTFEVVEMPVLKSVEFRGRTKIREKELIESTGLKPGARADHVRNQLAVAQIKRLYQEKGYELAEVTLVEGARPDDRRAIFQIFEGPKCRVTSIGFVGNAFVSDATLRTKISTKTPILGMIRGQYHRDEIEEDARKLREYYQGMGFFEVKVTPVTKPGSSLGDLHLEFVVWEGVQYKVRNIEFDGNKLIPTEKLRAGLVMHSGQPFSDALREADAKTMQEKYGEIGCIDAQIEGERKYADPVNQPGVIDIVYHVHEGEPYLLGHFIVRGNARTRDSVIRREAEMAGLVPGEPLDLSRVENFKKRIANTRYFVTDPQMGKPIDIQLINRRPHDQPYGEVPVVAVDDVIRTRMQDSGFDPEPDPDPVPEPAPPTDTGPAAIPGPPADLEPLAPGEGPAGIAPIGGASEGFAPPPDQALPPVDVPIAPDPLEPAPGPLDRRGVPETPVGQGEPPGTFPSLPGGNMTDVGPDRQEPFPNRSYADIVTQVEEAPTGRLMFGIGATSYGGLSGNFILHESNFDLLAVPRSWRELTSGQAFRGGGQDFRIELSPGTEINRALMSYRHPYLFDLPGGNAIGFGVSGYTFARFYPGQFNENRGGGRFSIGTQLGTSAYVDVAARVEDVRIYGFNYPAPAPFLAAEGHTFLSTLRPSFRIDNRNDPFAPNKGQYLEFAFEQGWGDFTFPKFTTEGRKYWTTGSRPDGTGKRILTLRGFFGITGRDTPVYETFYAGDFRSMRGFSYRGVGPRELGYNVGGIFTTIGSLEYQFPWTANDKLQQVVFTDFGTVEPDYSYTTFRCAIGTGLRIYLPQQMFGPLPLAFDFAYPIVKGPDDHTRLFTFFIGAFW
jgi:outer membrane protein insertion porin family